MLYKELTAIIVNYDWRINLEIIARIENLKYNANLMPKLKECNIEDFVNNKMARSSCYILNYKNNSFGVSQWVSPKRTRSYPYARVYDTMGQQVRITIIPFVKDEGFDGDRDFIQWDTVSLMSLLNIYVIIGYYCDAERNPRYNDKITNQILDYHYLKNQLDNLINYKSSALHWNLSQLDNSLAVAQKCKENYTNISEKLNVKMHSTEGIDRRIEVLKRDVEDFKKLSRQLSTDAQNREFQTIQPKEDIIEEKAKITITNYLGGLYHLTIDEMKIKNDKLYLIEKKYSKNALFPSIGDIKDGFVKMMLFTNLEEITIDNKIFSNFPVLGLTSAKFKGYCHSLMDKKEILNCLIKNNLKKKQQQTILSIFDEGRLNDFLIFLMDSNEPEFQYTILDVLKDS